MTIDDVPDGTSVVHVGNPAADDDSPVSVPPKEISFSPNVFTETERESEAEAVSPALTTLAEKLAVSVAVGVPAMTPDDDKLRPVGRLPLARNQLYDPSPPVALKLWLYAASTNPSGITLVVMLTTGPIVIERSASSV